MRRNDGNCDNKKSNCEERTTVNNIKREKETTVIKRNYDNSNNNEDNDDHLQDGKNCTSKNQRDNDAEKNSENENDCDKLRSMTSPTSVKTLTRTSTTETDSFRRPSSLKLFPNLPSLIDNCESSLFEHGLLNSCNGKQQKRTISPSSTTNFDSVASGSSLLRCFGSSSGSSTIVTAADTATNTTAAGAVQYSNESTLSSTTYSEPETPPDRGGAVTINSGLTFPHAVNSAFSAFHHHHHQQQQQQQHQQIYSHHSQPLISPHLFGSSYTNPYTFQQFNMLCAPWRLPVTAITAPSPDTAVGQENCDILAAATLAPNEPIKRTIATGELALPSLLATAATTPIYCAAQQPSLASQQPLGEDPIGTFFSHHFDDHNQSTSSGLPNFDGFLLFPDAPVIQNPFIHQPVTSRPGAGSNSPERQPLLLQPLSRLCAETASPFRAGSKEKGGEETNEEAREAEPYYHPFTGAASFHHTNQFHLHNGLQPLFESRSPNVAGELLPFTSGVASSSPEEFFTAAARNIMTRSSGGGAAALSANHQISGYATAPEPTAGRGRGNRRGGRKPREMEQHDLSQLSKVEMDKRAKRRERNKLAAARCRKRRLDLMQMLQNEVDQLRDENQHYKMTIEQLFRQKEQLVRELVGHPNCLLPKSGTADALKSAGVVEPAQFEQQLVSQQQHHFMLHHPQSSSSSSVVYSAAGPPMDSGGTALLMVPQALADGRLSASPSLMQQQYPPTMMSRMSGIPATTASSSIAVSSAQRSPLSVSQAAYDNFGNGSGRSSRQQCKMGDHEEEEEDDDDEEDDNDDEEYEEEDEDDQLGQLRRRQGLVVDDNDLFKADLTTKEGGNESVNDSDLTDEAEDKRRHMLMTDDDPVMSEAVLSADATTLMKRPRPVDRQAAAVSGGRKGGGQGGAPPQTADNTHHNLVHHHDQLEHHQREQHQEAQQHRPTTLPLYSSTTTAATTCDTTTEIGIASVQITTPSTGLLCQHDGYEFNLQNQRTYFTPMSGELKQL